MKNRTSFIIFIVLFALNAQIFAETVFAVAQDAFSVKAGKNATVQLKKVEQMPSVYAISDEKTVNARETVFYFVVYPIDESFKNPVFQETREFSLNNSSYEKLTKNQLGFELESAAEVYSFATFKQIEPEKFSQFELTTSKNGYVIKTSIIGASVHSAHTMHFSVFWGFNKELEVFPFSVSFIPQK